MNVFLDTSALVKRYVQEPGSERLEAILGSASELGVCVICLTEIISALCRRRRERLLSPQQYVKVKQALWEDLAEASVIHLTDPIIARAVELLESWSLRSADSLHVACAAEWSADLFVSADEQQCVAARGHGLRVENLACA